MSFPGGATARLQPATYNQPALTWADLDVVRTAVTEVAPSWSAELNRAGPDEATIVVMPEGANDLIGPAFVLFRDPDGVRLDQFRWDEYRKLGGFRSLHEALAALRTRLSLLVSQRASIVNSGDIR